LKLKGNILNPKDRIPQQTVAKWVAMLSNQKIGDFRET